MAGTSHAASVAAGGQAAQVSSSQRSESAQADANVKLLRKAQKFAFNGTVELVMKTVESLRQIQLASLGRGRHVSRQA